MRESACVCVGVCERGCVCVSVAALRRAPHSRVCFRAVRGRCASFCLSCDVLLRLCFHFRVIFGVRSFGRSAYAFALSFSLSLSLSHRSRGRISGTPTSRRLYFCRHTSCVSKCQSGTHSQWPCAHAQWPCAPTQSCLSACSLCYALAVATGLASESGPHLLLCLIRPRVCVCYCAVCMYGRPLHALL